LDGAGEGNRTLTVSLGRSGFGVTGIGGLVKAVC
jgi:hypothetical protein